MSMDQTIIEEIKLRLSERYTAMELVEILEVPVEDIIEIYFETILDNKEIMESVQ